MRITTHYDEGNLASSMYSVIHEGGHAKYELGICDEVQYTSLAGGVSMGVHESQSRFYENLIGRSLPFIQAIFPKMRELFPEQLGDGRPPNLWTFSLSHSDTADRSPRDTGPHTSMSGT